MADNIQKRVCAFRDFFERKNPEKLLGFFCGSEYPLFRYPSLKLPEDRPLKPSDFDIDDFVKDCISLYEKHEACGGDFIFSASAFWGIPWIEAMIGCPIYASYTTGSLYAEKPESPDVAPLWCIVTGDGRTLEILNGKGDAVLILGQDGSVTVPGEMKAGRYLSDKEEETSSEDDGMFRINADGHWHDLPVEYADNGRGSDGCRVYRICACWHHPRSGKYSVCEAVASHSDGSRRRIKSARKHWWGWSGKIKLRWQLHDGHLYLQMRSRRTRRGAEFISCRIQTVWDI